MGQQARTGAQAPIDGQISQSASSIKVDLKVETIQEKVARQTKIRGAKKARAKKATKALRKALRHGSKQNSKYRRLVRVKKEAEKAMLLANDKLYKLQQEEEKLRTEIDLMDNCWYYPRLLTRRPMVKLWFANL